MKQELILSYILSVVVIISIVFRWLRPLAICNTVSMWSAVCCLKCWLMRCRVRIIGSVHFVCALLHIKFHKSYPDQHSALNMMCSQLYCWQDFCSNYLFQKAIISRNGNNCLSIYVLPMWGVNYLQFANLLTRILHCSTYLTTPRQRTTFRWFSADTKELCLAIPGRFRYSRGRRSQWFKTHFLSYIYFESRNTN